MAAAAERFVVGRRRRGRGRGRGAAAAVVDLHVAAEQADDDVGDDAHDAETAAADIMGPPPKPEPRRSSTCELSALSSLPKRMHYM